MNKNKYFSKKMLAISTMLLMVMSIFVIPSSASANGGTYDYVIITTNDIVENSQELDFFIHMKEINGHSVLVVTEDDFGGLPGQYPNDRADKIRKWLQVNYVSLGIDYVLLIGDPDPDSFKESGDSIGDIPMKMCYPRYFRVGIGSPTDLYYSDLTSNWDLDGDGFYHESEDYNNPTSPHSSINKSEFSVIWTGKVYCDYTANYTFRILSEDGVKLTLDDTQVVIEDWAHDLQYDEGTISMSAGYHNIELRFKKHSGDGVAKLFWRTEVPETDYRYIKNEIIPPSHLKRVVGDLYLPGLTGEYFNDANFVSSTLIRYDPKIEFIWGTGDINLSDPGYDPEVSVGRIPVYNDDYDQLDKILRKIINYETDPGDISWRKSILLTMVKLNDTTSSAGLGEEINNYIATPNGFSSYRIYEPDAGFSPDATVPWK